jgi:DNA repair photolyase
VIATQRAWTTLDRRARGTDFIKLPFKSVLNTPEQTGMDFWSVNPYVGCEFGCSYCYARFTHQYVTERAATRGAPSFGAWSPDDFEHRIFVKAEAADVLALTLRPARIGAHAILIGSATDPYQPAERRFRVTRQILERLAQYHGLQIGLITKSPLVVRDIDVLARIAERNELTINISIVSMDAPLLRRLEARSPAPTARIRALEKLTHAGLHAGVMIAPVIPGVSDDVPHLEALLRAAKEAGARFAHAAPLRMYGGVKRRFLPVVAQEFPELLPKYERAFDRNGVVSGVYAGALKRRVGLLRRKIGLPSVPSRAELAEVPREAAQRELSL